MSKYPPEHKEQTRRLILDIASRHFREQGFQGASIQKIMQEAGLTVGGFYSHFKSKEDLIIQAFSQAIAETDDDLMGLLEKKKDQPAAAKALSKSYLSLSHCQNPSSGCPLPSLLVEIGRSSKKIKKAFVKEMESRKDIFAGFLPPGAEDKSFWPAIALMVGGVLLARAVDKEEKSQEILKSCQKYLASLVQKEK